MEILCEKKLDCFVESYLNIINFDQCELKFVNTIIIEINKDESKNVNQFMQQFFEDSSISYNHVLIILPCIRMAYMTDYKFLPKIVEGKHLTLLKNINEIDLMKNMGKYHQNIVRNYNSNPMKYSLSISEVIDGLNVMQLCKSLNIILYSTPYKRYSELSQNFEKFTQKLIGKECQVSFIDGLKISQFQCESYKVRIQEIEHNSAYSDSQLKFMTELPKFKIASLECKINDLKSWKIMKDSYAQKVQCLEKNKFCGFDNCSIIAFGGLNKLAISQDSSITNAPSKSLSCWDKSICHTIFLSIKTSKDIQLIDRLLYSYHDVKIDNIFLDVQQTEILCCKEMLEIMSILAKHVEPLPLVLSGIKKNCIVSGILENKNYSEFGKIIIDCGKNDDKLFYKILQLVEEEAGEMEFRFKNDVF